MAVCRRLPLTSCSLADPLGHRRPRDTGESGSPSICTTFSSLTYTFWPQPTAQYGQTLCTTRSAVEVRGVSDRVRSDVTDGPRPRKSPERTCRTTGQDRNVFFASMAVTFPGVRARRPSVESFEHSMPTRPGAVTTLGTRPREWWLRPRQDRYGVPLLHLRTPVHAGRTSGLALLRAWKATRSTPPSLMTSAPPGPQKRSVVEIPMPPTQRGLPSANRSLPDHTWVA